MNQHFVWIWARSSPSAEEWADSQPHFDLFMKFYAEDGSLLGHMRSEATWRTRREICEGAPWPAGAVRATSGTVTCYRLTDAEFVIYQLTGELP